MKKKVVIAVTLIAMLIMGLGVLTENPVVSCKMDIPENYLEAIESQAKGIYSDSLPLVPVFVSVTDYSAGTAYYTIYYLPFGTVGMSFTERDGYNIEKPLTGL